MLEVLCFAEASVVDVAYKPATRNVITVCDLG